MAILTPAQDGGFGPTPNPGTAPAQSPYDIFTQNLKNMLQQAQQGSSNAPLLKAKEAMNNQALNLSNPLNSTPYQTLFKGMTPTDSLQAQQGTQNAFQPGLTSINDQMANNTQNLNAFTGAVQTAYNTGNGDYVPTFNPSKGIMDGFSSRTGTWASDQGAQTTPTPTPVPVPPAPADTSGQHTGIVGGIDFSNGITGKKPYATDPNQPDHIQTLYDDMMRSLGGQPTAEGIDAYIKSHVKNSPLTGQMIIANATRFGIDPLVLTALFGAESSYGTAGAATHTMNPGNVGNTDNGSLNTLQNWNQGVYTAAKELSTRKIGTNAAAPAQNNSIPTGQNQALSTQPAVTSDGRVDFTSSPLLQGQSDYNKSIINGLLNYQTDPSSLPAGQMGQYYIGLAQRIDPTYTPSNYANHATFMNSWSSGALGEDKRTANTAIGHLAEVVAKFPSMANGPFSVLNSFNNAVGNAFGGSEEKGYSQAHDMFNAEMANLYHIGTGGGIAALEKYGKSNSSPAAEKEYLNTGISLMSSKLAAMAEQYRQAIGRPVPSLDAIIDPQNQVVLAKVLQAAGKSLSDFIPGVPISSTTQQLLAQSGFGNQTNVNQSSQMGLNQSSQSILDKYGIK